MKTTGSVLLRRARRMRPSGPRQRLRGEAENREAENAIARRDMGHARPDLSNDTTDFIAENARVRRITGIKRERFEHVAKIHSGRFDVDQDLAGAAWRQFKGSETKGIEMSALTGFETERQGGIEPLFAGRTAAIQALDVTRRGRRSRVPPICANLLQRSDRSAGEDRGRSIRGRSRCSFESRHQSIACSPHFGCPSNG